MQFQRMPKSYAVLRFFPPLNCGVRRLEKGMGEAETEAMARNLLARSASELADYSIGFVKLYEGESSIDGELGGSGTLVSINGRYAILTADHVLENLPNTGNVGLILPTRYGAQLHRVTLNMALAQKVRIARGTVESDGPDIGVLLIPTPIVSTIKASKSFYNLDKKNPEGSDSLPIDRGFWLLCGMAHEWTRDTSPEHGYQKVKIFRGICGAGIVSSERSVGEFDYLDFETTYDGAYEGPESYGGFSGGGLWQIDVAKTQNGELVIKDKILSGVIFYQSALENNCRTIVCHGRRSVYEEAAEAIRNAS